MVDRLSIGVDPDLHATAMALVRGVEGGLAQVQAVHVFRGEKTFKGHDAILDMIDELLMVPDVLHHWGVDPQAIVRVAIERPSLVRRVGVRKHARPDDIVNLTMVAGAAAFSLQASLDRGTLFLPHPSEWKGQVPKRVHQARMWRSLHVTYELRGSDTNGYVVPMGLLQSCNIERDSEWKHASDAVGLALWGLEQ